MDSEFKGHHPTLIDLLEAEDEQTVFDEHNETVDELFTCINRLVASTTVSMEPELML